MTKPKQTDSTPNPLCLWISYRVSLADTLINKRLKINLRDWLSGGNFNFYPLCNVKKMQMKHLVSKGRDRSASTRCHRVSRLAIGATAQMHEVSGTGDICVDRSLLFPDFFNPSCTQIRWLSPLCSHLRTGLRWCAGRRWIAPAPTVRTVPRFWSADSALCCYDVNWTMLSAVWQTSRRKSADCRRGVEVGLVGKFRRLVFWFRTGICHLDGTSMDRPERENIDSSNNSSDIQLTVSVGGHSSPSTPLSTGRLLARNANGTSKCITLTPISGCESNRVCDRLSKSHLTLEYTALFPRFVKELYHT